MMLEQNLTREERSLRWCSRRGSMVRASPRVPAGHAQRVIIAQVPACRVHATRPRPAFPVLAWYATTVAS